MTLLKELKKEFSLYEIALMTRSVAASLLGLNDHGHLSPGAIADIAMFAPNVNKETMFERASSSHSTTFRPILQPVAR
jgi:formylmethanofuran dehydrogenase subunit A